MNYTKHIGIFLTIGLLLVGTTSATSKKSKTKHVKTKKTEQKIVVPAKPSKRLITIHNNITNEMLPYKHWSGTYTPTSFELSIDGQAVKPGQKKIVTVIDDKLSIHYNYVFQNGRSGAKTVDFKVDSDSNKLLLTFNWKTKYRIEIDKAKAYQVTRIKKAKKKRSKKRGA